MDRRKRKSRGRPRRTVKGEFTPSLMPTSVDILRNKLLNQLISIPSSGQDASRRPVLIGYVSGSPLSPMGDRRLNRRGWCVVVWPLHLTEPLKDVEVFIPAGFVELRFTHKGTPVWDVVNRRFVESRRPSTLIVLARPPKVIQNLDDVTAYIDIGIHAPSYRLTVLGGPTANRGAEGEVLKQVAGHVGILDTIEVNNANRFRRHDGTYVFSLKVSSSGGKAKSVENRLPWRFSSISVALKGVSR